MSELLSRIYALLADVILPHLKSIETSQAEQRLETDRLNRNLEAFRTEMQIHFLELRAEIAACRQELEDTMVTLRESEAAEDDGTAPIKRKRIVN